ncbi:hypothetical protein EJ110_NYTH12994 [Nymphaea thermarum]|nr:hypothetical protein EJ110_NYTH12994 [Nymphaea thermarum]
MFLKSFDLSNVPKIAKTLFVVFYNIVQKVGLPNLSSGLANSEDKPSIWYSYEAMYRAKEAIQDNLKEKNKLIHAHIKYYR